MTLIPCQCTLGRGCVPGKCSRNNRRGSTRPIYSSDPDVAIAAPTQSCEQALPTDPPQRSQPARSKLQDTSLLKDREGESNQDQPNSAEDARHAAA